MGPNVAGPVPSAGDQTRIEPLRWPVATRLASRVTAIVSTNAPAVFTSAISATRAASGRAGGASRQLLARRAAPKAMDTIASPAVVARLTRKSYDGGRARNESAVSCSGGRPPGRRDLRAVPLLPLAGIGVRADRARGAARGARRRDLDARHARGGRHPSGRGHGPRHRIVSQRALAGLQDRQGDRPGP